MVITKEMKEKEVRETIKNLPENIQEIVLNEIKSFYFWEYEIKILENQVFIYFDNSYNEWGVFIDIPTGERHLSC